MNEAVFEMSLAAKMLHMAVRCYQLTLSWLVAGSCRHSPSCSAYAVEALEQHGAACGGWLALRRLMRCHPLGSSGYDPVPERLDPGNSGGA